MPELPEVETVARQLDEQIKGSTLVWLKAYDERLKLPKKISLSNSKIDQVFRMGKQIVFSFKGAPKKYSFLAVHLRMSGRLVCFADKERQNTETPKHHIRADIKLKNGVVTFIDPRRFGTMVFSAEADAFAPKGVEPLSPAFTSDKLESLIAKTSTPIKPWLLKQEKIVGIGNIYASEILFNSKISPLRPAGELNSKEIKRVRDSTVKILSRAIENCGTTFSDFQDAHGVTGSYQHFLKVYNREGEKCRRCGGLVQRLVQQQRSTFWCGGCQV